MGMGGGACDAFAEATDYMHIFSKESSRCRSAGVETHVRNTAGFAVTP
jgi:hypothetical protein